MSAPQLLEEFRATHIIQLCCTEEALEQLEHDLRKVPGIQIQTGAVRSDNYALRVQCPKDDVCFGLMTGAVADRGCVFALG